MPSPLPPTSNAPRKTYWKQACLFSLAAIAFWFMQFLLQAAGPMPPEDIRVSFIRSFAFAGTILISLSLFSSVLFKWVPRLAVHWRYRRYLGVSGFVFIFFHVLGVLYSFMNLDISKIFFSFNPFENPLLFGVVAFDIFLVMALTSTDWAMDRLTPKVWKFIHRFVYVGYIATIFHFILVNPPALLHPSGYLLIAITAMTVLGELYWFIKMAGKKRFMTAEGLVGLLLIVGTIILGYMSYEKLL